MLSFTQNPFDLNNLEVLNADEIKQFVKEINRIPDNEKRDLVIAIGTGGTISMEEVHKNGKTFLTPSLNFKNIFEKTEKTLDDKFYVKSFDAYAIDSSKMQYRNIHDLVIFMSYVSQNIKKSFLGFLVLHGTDTMAESSCHLAMQLGKGLPFPIVYTGAQKSIMHPLHDAGRNVRNSLYTLKTLKKNKFAEICIVFGDSVLFAGGATKISDTNRNAFMTKMHKPITDLSIIQFPQCIQPWIRKARKFEKFKPQVYSDYSHLHEISSKLSFDPQQIIRQIRDENVLGVLIKTYGAGTTDPKITRAIYQAIKEKNIPAFSISPFNTDHSLNNYETGVELESFGIYPLFMTLEFCRAKFEYALRKFRNDKKQIIKFMQKQYLGEIPTKESQSVKF